VSAVGSITVIGNGDIAGARYIVPLGGSSPSFYHSFTGGLDYKNFKQDVNLAGADTSIHTPIEYLPFFLGYSATWVAASKDGDGKGGGDKPVNTTTLDLGASFTLLRVGSSDSDFNQKRYGASSRFLVLHPSLGHLQPLPGNWSLFSRIDGQWASSPLISNEQYGAGGIDSVRGYEEAERLGDYGASESLELRTPPLLNGLSPKITKSYWLGFVEAGQLHVMDALPGTPTSYELFSAGTGLRFKASGLSIDLDAAHVFDNGEQTRAGANRGLFRVNYGF
jgi:hypothetical protein